MNLASYLIKGEINRFECVHPYIYASYDILDGMRDVELSNRIRDHLISIEDAFVHSQEWTLSRNVSEIKIAFLGSPNSGKSGLIHFFLTGVYVQDDSPEGGRFKKLYFSHSLPQLLLIRDEAGAPDIQLASWADALVVVVSLADVESVRIASEYYAMFCGLRDKLDIPTMLIATQDGLISGSSVPAIELHVRHLLNSMNWCPYHETCAVYGLNVETVFQEIVSRVLSQRKNAHLDVNPSVTRDGLNNEPRTGSVPNTLPMQPNLSRSDGQSTDSNHQSGDNTALRPGHLVNTVIQTHSPPSVGIDPNRIHGAPGPECTQPPNLLNPLISCPIGTDMSFTLSDNQAVRTGGPRGPCPLALHLLQSQHDCLSSPAGQSRTLLPADGALHSSWINSKPLPPCPPTQLSMLTQANGLLGPFSSMTLSTTIVESFVENQPQPLGTLFQSSNSTPLPFMMSGNQTDNPPDTFLHNHGKMGPVSCSTTILPGSLTENSPGTIVSRRLPALPRHSEPDNTCHFASSLTPPSLGTPSQGRISDCSMHELAHTNQQLLSHPHPRRDRPRPQSTGSLSGSLAGLTSVTLCTMGMNFTGTAGLIAGKSRDHNQNVGAGRLIPLKQGYLYKRSIRGLSKESRRRKKYVVITEDARLCYHPSKQDYVNSQHGKSIDLTISTIKLPGMAYRMSSCGLGALVDSHLGISPVSTSQKTPVGATTITSGPIGAMSGSSEMINSFILPSAVVTPSSSASSVAPIGAGGGGLGLATITSTPKSRTKPEATGRASLAIVKPESDLNGSGSLLLIANQSSSGPSDSVAPKTSSTNPGVVTPPTRTSVGGGVGGSGRTLREAMKRHYKRAKAAMADNSTEPQENHDFIIVTADNTQWHFEAPSTAIRDEWIQQIDAVIHHRLRSGVVSVVRNNSTSVHPSDTATSAVFTDRIIPPQTGRLGNRPLSTGAAGSGTTDGLFKLGGGEDVCGQEEVLQRLSALAGNDCCADCGAPNPEWASLNLVVLICIECSGVHRELGTHISRVRSATLDTWTREHLAVMASFGNTLANSVWEASAPSKAKQFKKPEPTSPRDVRSAWIQNKYLRRVFLPPLPHTNRPMQQEVIDALVRRDARTLLMCLALGGNSAPHQIQSQSTTAPANPASGGGGSVTDGVGINLNAPYSSDDSRNALHFAAILGDLASLQLLIWHGADVNATDNYGLTAWSYAHVCHQIACTRLLHMNGCHTVSPLGVPADWLQLMRIPFPLSMQTNLLTCTNLSLDVSASSPRAGFQSSDSGSHSCSSSTSSSPAASESDADESRPFEDAAVRPPVV